MKRTIIILLSILILTGIVSCSSKDEVNSKHSSSTSTLEKEQSCEIKQIEKREDFSGDHSTQPGKRKYKFPSIMVKEDMYHEDYITPDRKTTLKVNLIVNGWNSSGDQYGRTFIYASPEITYSELQDYLHFNDSDVTYSKDPKPGEPQASIQTEWLTCNITFVSKLYDSKDKRVKVKAVVIDNETKAFSDKETAYRKNRGVIRKVLDFFEVVHQ